MIVAVKAGAARPGTGESGVEMPMSYPATYQPTTNGLAFSFTDLEDTVNRLKNVPDAVAAIPRIADNTDTIKAMMPLLIGGVILLAAVVYFKR